MALPVLRGPVYRASLHDLSQYVCAYVLCLCVCPVTMKTVMVVLCVSAVVLAEASLLDLGMLTGPAGFFKV